MAKRSFWSRLLTVLVFMAGTVCVFLAVGYWMLTYRPKDYNPQPISKIQQQEAENDALKIAEQFHNSVYKSERFVINIKQEMLNKLLLHDEVTGFIRGALHGESGISERVQVRLANSVIYFMDQVEYRGVSSVLTMGFRAELLEGGRLRLSLLPVKIGVVRMPQEVVDEQLAVLGKKLQDIIGCHNGNTSGYNDLNRDLFVDLAASLTSLHKTKEVVTRSVFDIDRNTRAVLVGIKITDGQADLEFEPLVSNGR